MCMLRNNQEVDLHYSMELCHANLRHLNFNKDC